MLLKIVAILQIEFLKKKSESIFLSIKGSFPFVHAWLAIQENIIQQ